MNRIEIDAAPKSEIHIETVGRALYVKSWDLPKARIDFFDDQDIYEQKGKRITLSSSNDCILRVPVDSSVIVGHIGADANIKGITGKLRVENVGGSIHLKRLSDVEIVQINGNLTARDIAGDIRVDEVMGNAAFKNIHGKLQAKNVSANFDLRNGGENVNAESMGNANIRTLLPANANYKIKCAGNAYCKIEETDNLQASLKSGAEQILVQTATENQSLQVEKHVVKLGDGRARINLDAGGHIDFQVGDQHEPHFEFRYELDDDFDNMVGEISDQISVQLESQLESLEQQLDSLSDHIQSASSKGLRKAQQKVEEAQRKLEQRISARGAKGARKPIMGVGTLHNHAEPVSEQERMKVLEMVQEKKISVDEAEALLATLEGRKIEGKASETKAEEENES